MQFWDESVLTASYLINRTPTATLYGKTPYELLYGAKASYRHLRVFGCLCYAHYASRGEDKFAARSRRCIFVGYPHGQKGWRVYDLESRRFLVSRDVVISEDTFPFAFTSPGAETPAASDDCIFLPKRSHDHSSFLPEAQQPQSGPLSLADEGYREDNFAMGRLVEEEASH